MSSQDQPPQEGNPSSFPSNIGSPMGNREYTYFRQNSARCIFIRDLPFHFRDEQLRRVALDLLPPSHAEHLETSRVKYSKDTGKTLQVGIIMMRSAESAQFLLNLIQENPRHGGRDIR